MGKHSHKDKHKKHKKDKKKHKKREKQRSSSSSSASRASGDEWVEKDLPKKPEEQPSRELKRPQDDWDLFQSVIPSSARPDRKAERDEAKRKEREANQYDPSKCSRELNPYWKDGGDGLPSARFLKPEENRSSVREYKRSSTYSSSGSNWRKKTSDRDDGKESRDEYRRRSPQSSSQGSSGSNWRKKDSTGEDSRHASTSASGKDDRDESRRSPSPNHRPSSSNWKKSGEEHRRSSPSTRQSSSGSNWRKKTDCSESQHSTSSSSAPKRERSPPAPPNQEEVQEEVLTDKQLNELAAKLVKAEIMGNNDLAEKLKQKLDRARNAKKQDAASKQEDDEDEGVILTRTDSKGFSRPLSSSYSESDKYGGRRSKKQKVETHDAGDRIRYFADDDKYSLQEMFENEKFNTTEQQEEEFVNMAGKIAKNDDLDDSFADKIRRKESSEKSRQKAKDKAIGEHQRVAKSLDNCPNCLQSTKIDKHLMIALGQNAYLTLPAHEPLTEGHCIIIPNRHVTCGTQLDENEWEDVMDMRKALTRMFLAKGEDVIFFEIATGLHKFPHMTLECVPVPKEDGDMAPIYFKKAIDECEMEWATNKKLVSLKGRDVRKAVPKGLSYFCVSFGMDEGYAHVIEEQALFPSNFAQEIIGGMLDLHHSKWRKPRKEQFDVQKQRVLQFSKEWVDYDCTGNK